MTPEITTAALVRATYEAPLMTIYGPVWPALACGFAVYIGGELHLTQAGQDYLDQSFHAMTQQEAEDRLQ
jgi:hypothetical protein